MKYKHKKNSMRDLQTIKLSCAPRVPSVLQDAFNFTATLKDSQRTLEGHWKGTGIIYG
jgi:hypothetical protein